MFEWFLRGAAFAFGVGIVYLLFKHGIIPFLYRRKMRKLVQTLDAMREKYEEGLLKE